MPLFGAHMSISGGLDQALIRGKKAGCQVIQIFTGNTSRWVTRKLQPAGICSFNKARADTSVEPVAAHAGYLINLASTRSEIRDKSFSALLDEMERAEALKIPYLVIHPGAHLGDGEEPGLRRISCALKKLLNKTPGFRLRILLETTAGQGTNLGYRFEHLAEILERSDAKERMGICLDTCHIFAAGYDFRTKETYEKLIKSFDDIIGLSYLKLLHINDSKKGLNSRIDRHEHLGYGLIGKEGISFFVKDPRLKDLPFIIETPKGKNDDGIDWDVSNLSFLRGLAGS